MRRFLVVLALVLIAVAAAAQAPNEIARPAGNDHNVPKPSRCCGDKVYDAKGHLIGDLMIWDTYHRVSWASVRYTLKGGDTVALLVSPWTILTDLQPGGSTLLFQSNDCSGDALAIFGNYPQLMKRQAVIAPLGTYYQYFPDEAWLYVSDPYPLPLTSFPPSLVFHSQWDYGHCSPYPAPGYTPGGFVAGAVWVHRTEDLLKKFVRPFWTP